MHVPKLVSNMLQQQLKLHLIPVKLLSRYKGKQNFIGNDRKVQKKFPKVDFLIKVNVSRSTLPLPNNCIFIIVCLKMVFSTAQCRVLPPERFLIRLHSPCLQQ